MTENELSALLDNDFVGTDYDSEVFDSEVNIWY